MVARIPESVDSVLGGEAHLARQKVNVWDGDNYAWELAAVLGVRDIGGTVRRPWCHNDRSDVDRLLAAVAELGG